MKVIFTLLLIGYCGSLSAQTPGELLTFPIELKYFRAEKKAEKIVLNWLAPCQVSEATFEIQHSSDARNFSTIWSTTADKVRCEQPFEFTDAASGRGQQFYRIKMTTVTNQTLNSFVLSVFNGVAGFELNALLPSIVTSATTLHLSSATNDILKLSITTHAGIVYSHRTLTVVPGTNQVPLDFGVLPKGIYVITVMNQLQQIKTIRFIKR